MKARREWDDIFKVIKEKKNCQPGAFYLVKLSFRNGDEETFLVVQWLRLGATNAGGLGSIPGQGNRSHMLQLRFGMPQLKVSYTATGTPHSQIRKEMERERLPQTNKS